LQKYNKLVFAKLIYSGRFWILTLSSKFYRAVDIKLALSGDRRAGNRRAILTNN